MISLALTVTRLLRALARGLRDPAFRGLVFLTLALLASGTVFYSSVEGWSILDALYFSVMTLTTVGYGDLAPHTALGKIFTMLYVLVGLGILVALVQGIAAQMLAAQQDRRTARQEWHTSHADKPEKDRG
jgi:voltage-gated potassium channel Kch